MSYTYYSCRNLTGNPVCGDNVTNMRDTYYGARFAYVSTALAIGISGPDVLNMDNAYSSVIGVRSIVIGPNVTTANYVCYNTHLDGSDIYVCTDKLQHANCIAYYYRG